MVTKEENMPIFLRLDWMQESIQIQVLYLLFFFMFSWSCDAMKLIDRVRRCVRF